MKNKWLILLLIGSLLFYGCKTPKDVAGPEKIKRISPKVLDTQLAKQDATFDWFSAKVKMNYDDGRTSQSFTANIRFKKDSVVWMSLTGMFGIEGGRVLITPDSIQIIDRLKKEYYKYPLTFIENYLPFRLSIKDIQQILLGNRFVPMNGKRRVVVDQDKYLVSSIDNFVESRYWVYPKNYTYAEMRLKDQLDNRQFHYKFDDYKKVEDKLIAYDRTVEFINGSSNIMVDMSFTKIKVNEPLMFPFDVPSKYK